MRVEVNLNMSSILFHGLEEEGEGNVSNYFLLTMSF
jgi:hypothetical protein